MGHTKILNPGVLSQTLPPSRTRQVLFPLVVATTIHAPARGISAMKIISLRHENESAISPMDLLCYPDLFPVFQEPAILLPGFYVVIGDVEICGFLLIHLFAPERYFR